MTQCMEDVFPLLTHWSYVFLALNLRYVMSMLCSTNLIEKVGCYICLFKRQTDLLILIKLIIWLIEVKIYFCHSTWGVRVGEGGQWQVYLIFLPMDLILECWNKHVTIGLLYVKFVLSTRIFYRGVWGFTTDCSCDVWCCGLTTCLLCVSLLLFALFTCLKIVL